MRKSEIFRKGKFCPSIIIWFQWMHIFIWTKWIAYITGDVHDYLKLNGAFTIIKNVISNNFEMIDLRIKNPF